MSDWRRALFKFAQAADLSQRSVHVPREQITPVGEYDYQPVKIFIQEHMASRRGKHYDLRIVTPTRAISFVIPWGNLTDHSPGTGGKWIRMPDHTIPYASWSGIIPKGQYGAGTVKVVADYNGVLNKNKNGTYDLTYESGDDVKKLSFSPSRIGNTTKYFAIFRNLPKQHHWQERPPYKDAPKDMDPSGMLASEKLDGALVYAVLTEKGISITSRRKSSKNGQLLIRENHVPWIRDTRVPKEYQGMVLAAELVHPKGFGFVGPLMNSKPLTAINKQEAAGRMILAPHNILNVNMPYGMKVSLMHDIVKALGNNYIRMPEFSDDPQDLYERVKNRGGEGIIMVDPNSTSGPMYKKKAFEHYVGEIVDYTKGRPGKFQNMLGALIVKDNKGNLVNIGGGVGMDEEMRKEILQNWNKYKGRKIRIVAEGSTGSSLRQPRFAGFELDETPLDTFETQEETYSRFMNSLQA